MSKVKIKAIALISIKIFMVKKLITPIQYVLKKDSRYLSLLALGILGSCFWHMNPPEGLSAQGWQLLVLFVATIVGIILKPLPMSGVALLSLAIGVFSGTFSIEQAFAGYSVSIVWLVVFAFFLALGFMNTGLGTRVAYFFIALLGKRTLGLAYGLTLTDFLLSPFIPSTTARGAGVVLPIVKAIAHEQGSRVEDGTAKKMGAYLIKVCFQVNTITSALFLTAIVCNPLIAQFAKEAGVTLDWLTWAKATIVPGILNLAIIPWVLYKIYPPEIKQTPHAAQLAKEKLQAMGPLNVGERTMLGVFAVILTLWIGGKSWGVDPTAAALLGVVALLVLGVIKMEHILNEKSAWDTFLWFGPLLMMAGLLPKMGVTAWFSGLIHGHMSIFSWPVALGLLGLIYYFIHYFFASVTAHIMAFYSAFLATLIALGAPPMLSAMMLAVLSTLSGVLTHYGTSPAPVYFGTGYVGIREWWGLSLVTSAVNLTLWITVGGLWWKALGFW